MTAPDHTTKPHENILHERGHPYMSSRLRPQQPSRRSECCEPQSETVDALVGCVCRKLRPNIVVMKSAKDGG
jgi:hypothetical protein